MREDSALQHKEINAASAAVLRDAILKTGCQYGFIGPVIEGGPQKLTLRVLAYEGFRWDQIVNRAMYEKVRSDYSELGFIDFPYMDNLFGWPITHGQSLLTNEPTKDYRRSGRTPAGHPPLNNFLGCPIFHAGVVVGTVGLANKPDGFTDAERDLVERLGTQLSALYEFYRRGIRQIEAERKQLHAERENQELGKRLLELSYAVSHELQGPCNVLDSKLRLLSSRYHDKLGADADELISESLQASRTISRMVDDLWTFARVERGTQAPEQIDLSSLVPSVVQALSLYLEERNAKVELGALGKVWAVKRQMEYLVEELIRNCVTFNDAECPVIRICSQRLVEETVLEFEDNGRGFDPTELPQLTKMFVKDPKSSGNGMGLAIVSAIMRFHGGRLTVDSLPGRGSHWFISFPDSKSKSRNEVPVAS